MGPVLCHCSLCSSPPAPTGTSICPELTTKTDAQGRFPEPSGVRRPWITAVGGRERGARHPEERPAPRPALGLRTLAAALCLPLSPPVFPKREAETKCSWRWPLGCRWLTVASAQVLGKTSRASTCSLAPRAAGNGHSPLLCSMCPFHTPSVNKKGLWC